VVHRKNDRGTKDLTDYTRLMAEAFREMYRVLKPGRYATIEFNNSDGQVFEAIKDAVRGAGFAIENGCGRFGIVNHAAFLLVLVAWG